MIDPAPAVAPETLVELWTVQVKVVPGILFGFVIAIDVVPPLQICVSLPKAVGSEFTFKIDGLLVTGGPHVPLTSTV